MGIGKGFRWPPEESTLGGFGPPQPNKSRAIVKGAGLRNIIFTKAGTSFSIVPPRLPSGVNLPPETVGP